MVEKKTQIYSDDILNRAKRHMARAVNDRDIKKLNMLISAGFPVDTPINRNKQTALMLFA